VNRIPRSVKAAIGLAFLAALLLQLDWSAHSHVLDTVRWPLVGLTALLYPLSLLLNAAKWSAALRLHDLSFGFTYLLRAGCGGFFVNNLLPSAIGGDVYRVYRSSADGATSQAVSAVLLERLVGLSVLLLNGLLGAVLLVESSSLARAYLAWLPAAALAAAMLIAALAILRRREIAAAACGSKFLQPVIANLRRIARLHPAWIGLLGYSVAFQIVAVAAMYCAFEAVGADFTLGGALLVTAAAGLAAVVPISISGIGIVEGSIVGVGVALGVGYEPALLAAIVLRTLSLATSLGCGVVYAFEGSRRSMQAA
jgi:uncharacterized membrane protein YbhN (UPF0104 family)